jgi:restriction endonuclease S subunit
MTFSSELSLQWCYLLLTTQDFTHYLSSAKTLVTPKSAMTLVTHFKFAKSHGATEGARRATGVASCDLAGRRSLRAVLVLSDRSTIDANDQPLLPDVYRGNSVFIRGLRGHLESLTKDVQHQITPNEPHQVISAGGGLRQRVSGSLGRFWKPYGVPTLIQRSLRRPSSQLAVPVSSIVFLLEYQRLLSQLFFSLHRYSAKKALSIVIVKLFNDAIPPRLTHRYKPGFDPVEQTQSDQVAHPSRKLTAAKENRFVIHLLVVGYTQTLPARPDSIHGILTSLVENRTDRTPPSRQIDAVQAVKPNRPIQITRTYIVRLMNLVYLIGHQRRVLPSFGFLRPRSSVRQLFSTKDPIYGSQRWHRLDALLPKLPLNCLRTAEQSVVIEIETNNLNRFNDVLSQLTWAALRARRSTLVPVRCVIGAVMPLHPFINPFSRVTHRSSDGSNSFTARVPINRNLPIALPFSLHRRLHLSKGINVDQKLKSRKPEYEFQRTVTNVLALKCVTKVLALINYQAGTAVPALQQGVLERILIHLPPLPEQHRIVTQVDELMELCDRLDAAQADRECQRSRLVASSLHRLTQPVTHMHSSIPDDFREHAHFYLNHLPRVTMQVEHIKQLRQTILNLAVRGKLVQQESNDDPIRATLRLAMKQRQSLGRSQKARHKKLESSEDLGKQDDLPETWIVERLGNLVDPENTISYGVLVPGNDVRDGIPFVRAQDLSLSSPAQRPNKTISPEIENAYARTRLRGGEILLCVVGSIGKLGIAPPSWAGANIARAVVRIAPIPEISRDYLVVVLRGHPVQTYFAEATRTLAQPTLNVSLIEQAPIPLPPLAEQHRIVAKVDELMSLCDQLEAQLTTAKADSRRLLEAVLQEALGQAG